MRRLKLWKGVKTKRMNLSDRLLDLPNEFNDKFNKVSERSNEVNIDDNLPF